MLYFKNCRLARMSDGHYCVIRDLGLVKGGKGMKHHDVLIDLTLRGALQFLKRMSKVGNQEGSAHHQADAYDKQRGNCGCIPAHLVKDRSGKRSCRLLTTEAY